MPLLAACAHPPPISPQHGFQGPAAALSTWGAPGFPSGGGREDYKQGETLVPNEHSSLSNSHPKEPYSFSVLLMRIQRYREVKTLGQSSPASQHKGEMGTLTFPDESEGLLAVTCPPHGTNLNASTLPDCVSLGKSFPSLSLISTVVNGELPYRLSVHSLIISSAQSHTDSEAVGDKVARPLSCTGSFGDPGKGLLHTFLKGSPSPTKPGPAPANRSACQHHGEPWVAGGIGIPGTPEGPELVKSAVQGLTHRR